MTNDLIRYRRIARDLRGKFGFDQSVQTVAMLLHEYGQSPQDIRQEIVGDALMLVTTGFRMYVEQNGFDFSDREVKDVGGAVMAAALDLLAEMPTAIGHA